jgi:hypothetical protein
MYIIVIYKKYIGVETTWGTQLYLGNFQKFRLDYQLAHFFRGYKEIPEAPVNQTVSVIRVTKVISLCKSAGFRIIKTGSSYKTAHDGYPNAKGGQNYIKSLLSKKMKKVILDGIIERTI